MYKRILVPIDGSATSTRGLDEAMALARSGGELHLVHVIDLHSFMYASSDGMVMADATLNSLHDAGRALLTRFEAKVAAAGLKVSSEHGSPLPAPSATRSSNRPSPSTPT